MAQGGFELRCERLGEYAREFFVSQTPELTAMADEVIDLDTLVRSQTTDDMPQSVERSGWYVRDIYSLKPLLRPRVKQSL